MTLQEHADEETLELAVVGLACGDLGGTAGGLDGGAVGEAGFGEGKESFDEFGFGSFRTFFGESRKLPMILGKRTGQCMDLILGSGLEIVEKLPRWPVSRSNLKEWEVRLHPGTGA
jgi:hypothetical protein